MDIILIWNATRTWIEWTPVLGHLRPVLPDGGNNNPLA
jgi:hypothetical protein